MRLRPNRTPTQPPQPLHGFQSPSASPLVDLNCLSTQFELSPSFYAYAISAFKFTSLLSFRVFSLTSPDSEFSSEPKFCSVFSFLLVFCWFSFESKLSPQVYVIKKINLCFGCLVRVFTAFVWLRRFRFVLVGSRLYFVVIIHFPYRLLKSLCT